VKKKAETGRLNKQINTKEYPSDWMSKKARMGFPSELMW
jgi:hypothetical protein